jgi:hypothetical protein
MKKILNYLLMAATVCGISLAAASCSSNDDNPATPDLNLSEKIIGKWMTADRYGQPAPTNKKKVFNIVSTTKAYMSASLISLPEVGSYWIDVIENDVAISGNIVTLTNHPDEHRTVVEEYTVTAINDKEFTANRKMTIMSDGVEVVSEEGVFRYVKVAADYTAAILGLWECTELTGIETYNDANARLEFLADGTYRYYRKSDGGEWQAVTTREFQNYFVDGTLLATRWKNQGEDELREWWEVESLSGDQMTWTALRQNADGSTAQQKMTWKRIDLNVSEKIIGKWMTAESKGKLAVTNRKSVVTFVSATKAYMSKSFDSRMESGDVWISNEEADVVISGNKVTLTSHSDEHTTRVNEYIITDINGIEFTANVKLTKIVDGNVVLTRNNTTRLTKVTADYSAAIVGTWQGRCTSEGSVFDDGQEHRWQYKADGTYVYYVKSGDNWVPYEGNTLNEYFVDGTLLCTRWIDLGQENREWWEITIDGSQMHWTALRQNPDGTTFTATFEMEKVE